MVDTDRRSEAKRQFDRIMRQPAARRRVDLKTTHGRGKIDEPRVKEYVDWGFTGQQCADAHLHETGIQITRQAVSLFRQKIGKMARDVNPHQKKLIPWRVRVEHGSNRYVRALRAEARIRNNESVNTPSLQGHASVMIDLADGNRVIDYDEKNGFMLVARRRNIDHDLIREPLLDDSGNLVADPKQLRREQL